MVLNHVAQRAGAVVVHRARAHAFLLRDGYLHVIDAAVVPEVLEDAVGEPQHHQVLHRLFAEVMVDAEDLALVQMLAHLADDVQRAVQVVADRLLDHDPGEMRCVGRRDQSSGVELLNALERTSSAPGSKMRIYPGRYAFYWSGAAVPKSVLANVAGPPQAAEIS